MTLESDSLLAVTGLIPGTVAARQHRAAATLPDTFERRALAWWTAERKTFANVADIDLEKTFEAIVAPPAREEIASWLVGADTDDDTDRVALLQMALTKAREWLVQRWPRIVVDTFAGPRLLGLGVDDVAEITSLFAVLDEPTRILDEMDMGSLSPSQAEAFRICYPSLYEHYRNALATGAAKETAKDLDWMPSEDHTVLLGILTGQPPGPLTYVTDAPPENAPNPPKDLGASNAETQLDKSSRPMSAKR